MELNQVTVRGAGKLHDVITRRGQHFRIFVKDSGGTETYVYPESDDGDLITVELDADEADMVANILHSRPIVDRLWDLERRVGELETRLRRDTPPAPSPLAEH